MRDRRGMLVLLAGAAVLPFCACPLAAQTPAMSHSTAYAFSFKALDGSAIRLAEFAGRPILIVNVASQCGHTPQYSGLRSLQERFGPQGLVILGVPSNDFDQEPGGASEILATAHGEYGVSFPLTKNRRCVAPMHIPSIAGRRPSGRSMCQSGISTST